MVKLYFGLPGCGKTTLMAKMAKEGIKKYKHVYGNVQIGIEGYTYIDNDCIGQYMLEDCLILIDEGTIFADSRDYKSFSKDKIEFFLTHRHYNVDIVIFTQQWDGVDRKIRVITDRVYYMYKPFILGKWVTNYYRIPYEIIIPDRDAEGNVGEIIQGYCKPTLFNRIFCNRLYRPKYYRYFDSFEKKKLPVLPNKYMPYTEKKTLKTKRQRGLP